MRKEKWLGTAVVGKFVVVHRFVYKYQDSLQIIAGCPVTNEWKVITREKNSVERREQNSFHPTPAT